MAERVEPVPAWEKSGNVTWVQCSDCRGWVPVDPKLVEAPDIHMVCPHCAASFTRSSTSVVPT